MNTLLTIARKEIAPEYTLGHLLYKEERLGWTIERPVRKEKVHGQTAIWEGVYPLTTYLSPSMSALFLWSAEHRILIDRKDQKNYPHVKDFTPHRMIEISGIRQFDLVYLHWGNTAKDSKGCPIVGTSSGWIKGERAVIRSRDFYRTFYERVFPAVEAAEAAGTPEQITITKALGVELR